MNRSKKADPPPRNGGPAVGVSSGEVEAPGDGWNRKEKLQGVS